MTRSNRPLRQLPAPFEHRPCGPRPGARAARREREAGRGPRDGL